MQALSISEGDGRLPKSSTSTTDGTAEVSFPGPLASTTDVEADVVKDERSFGDFHFISFHFISFHIFMEGGPSVITDLQGALRLHYTYITSRRKIITNMKTN